MFYCHYSVFVNLPLWSVCSMAQEQIVMEQSQFMVPR